MLLDLQNVISDSQNLAQVVGSYLSDFSIDTGVAGSLPLSQSRGDSTVDTARKDLGSALIDLLVQVDTTFTSGGSGTLQVDMVMADDAALATNLVVLKTTPAIALATLIAGYQFRIGTDIPPGATKRFIGLRYVVGGATMTAGTVTAGIINDRQTSGYNY